MPTLSLRKTISLAPSGVKLGSRSPFWEVTLDSMIHVHLTFKNPFKSWPRSQSMLFTEQRMRVCPEEANT